MVPSDRVPDRGRDRGPLERGPRATFAPQTVARGPATVGHSGPQSQEIDIHPPRVHEIIRVTLPKANPSFRPQAAGRDRESTNRSDRRRAA